MQHSIWHPCSALAAACACLALLAGCGASSRVSEAAAPVPPASASYVLRAGQSVAMTARDTLKLERVNDSRCRIGAVCVWAGYISYSFTLSDGVSSSAFVLSDSMPGGTRSVRRKIFTFTLESVEPALPPAAKGPEPDYRVTVRVTVNPA